MTHPQLTPYAENSTEAMLRAITLFIVSDGDLADSELDTVDRLGVLDTLGADRERFAQVFDAYCDDLIAHAGTARYVGLADPDWVDAVLAPVTDPDRRRYIAAALLLI
ncbi:MAG: TerB family tellurite resistance protein, partial [Chromatiaceae bacterium]